jgi:hypothetical protein
LQVKHSFDRIPAQGNFQVSPASAEVLAQLTDLAEALVPNVAPQPEKLTALWRRDPATFLAFTSESQLLGGIGLLYLNEWGLDALILDDITLTDPEFRFLCKADERPAAIYWWAIAARGRGIAALGELGRYLSAPRYAGVDFYAQPSSDDGRRLAVALGFKQIPSFQRDLWQYERLPVTSPQKIAA